MRTVSVSPSWTLTTWPAKSAKARQGNTSPNNSNARIDPPRRLTAQYAGRLTYRAGLREKRKRIAGDIQHSDAIILVQHVEKALLADPGYVMSYADAAGLLNRKPAKGGRHVGQVVSCIRSN